MTKFRNTKAGHAALVLDRLAMDTRWRYHLITLDGQKVAYRPVVVEEDNNILVEVDGEWLPAYVSAEPPHTLTVRR